MKNTVKFIMIAATTLSLTSCGNDKKNDKDAEEVLVEERMVDEEEMQEMVKKHELFKTKAITMFAVVQIMMAGLVTILKFFI